MRKRIKKPYIAAVFIAFFVLFSVNSMAYSGSALVEGKSYDVEKVYSYSNGVTSATPIQYAKSAKVSVQLLYQIKMPELTVKTPVATTCYWNKASEDRRCVQTVEIDNAGVDLELKEAFGASTPFKNLVIKAPDVLKKGAYNVTYEFDYPANKGEEWNLTFSTPSVTFLIDPTITECGILNATGETYLLTQNTTGICDMAADNIVLDCQNFFIISDVGGVYTHDGTFNNITVKNCNVVGSLGNYNGIYIEASNSFIINNTVSGFDDCIKLDSNYGNTTNNLIENNTMYNCTTSALNWQIENSGYFYFDNLVDNNYINGGFLPEYEPGPDLLANKWNITRQTGTRIYSAGTEIGGNYWTNSTANGYSDTCTDLLQDGFCDDPYDVEANASCAAVADGLPACGNNTDWLPLSAFYEEPPCVPSWNCTAWGECVRGYQSRVCTDDNSCQNETGKPAQSQACLKTLPNATFNVSGDCCPISTFYCTDNETLVQLWNTSDGVSWALETCEFGCDNVTDSCTPVPYAQNLWLLVIFAAIVVVGLAFIRWVR